MKREAPEDATAGPPGKRARSPTAGQPATGRIVNFFASKGYGFIESSVSAKDVFFPKVALPMELQELDLNQLKGMEVSFQYLEVDGKPRADHISSRMSIPGRLADRGEPRGEPRDRGARPGDRNSGAMVSIHMGTLRSYDAKKGFGFILPDDLPDDVFYLRSELPPELDGVEPTRNQVVDRRVEFEVKQMENGKLRAQRLRFVGGSAGSRGPLAPPRAPPMAPMGPVIPAARPMNQMPSGPSGHREANYSYGRIRNYYPSKGYGFIEANGQSDLFFLPSSLPKEFVESKQPLEGMEITFEAYTNEEGKARARNIQPYLPPPPRVPQHSSRAPPPPPIHMVQMLPPAPMVPQGGMIAMTPKDPRVAVGTVQNFDATKGFGFIRVDGLPSDIFFPRGELPPELREEEKEKIVGSIMEFEVKTMPDGKMRARKMLQLRRMGGPRARGKVIKYHQDKGYGFMDCGWANNVFFLKTSLPKDLNDATLEELQQLEMSFEVSSKEPGKPRASHLQVLGREAPADTAADVPQNGEVLNGEVVNFDPNKDFGFVRARGYNQDIYFNRADLPPELSEAKRRDEVLGEKLEFEVEVKPDGKLRAHQMRTTGEEESDLEDDLVQQMEDFLVDKGNRQNYGIFTNKFPKVRKKQIQKFFRIVDAGPSEPFGKQYVELPLDHPRRIAEEAPSDEGPKDPEDLATSIEPKEEYVDDFPEASEAQEFIDEVDPNEPAIPLGPGLHPLGVIRDYDAKRGFGFIRCQGLPEDVFFPRKALPKSFQGQQTRDMPELKGVQVSFDYNPSGGRGPRSDAVQLLLRWLPADKCWLLKRGQIPAKS